jgi:hypothetical protein
MACPSKQPAASGGFSVAALFDKLVSPSRFIGRTGLDQFDHCHPSFCDDFAGLLADDDYRGIRVAAANGARHLAEEFVEQAEPPVGSRGGRIRIRECRVATICCDRRLRRTAVELRRRSRALVEGMSRHCGERVVIQNSGAGMHLVAWLPGFDQPGLQRLIAAAQQRGVGLHGPDGRNASTPQEGPAIVIDKATNP